MLVEFQTTNKQRVLINPAKVLFAEAVPQKIGEYQIVFASSIVITTQGPQIVNSALNVSATWREICEKLDVQLDIERGAPANVVPLKD